jgi:hypothetical protein
MIRFGFQIRTKSGQRIDTISIIAAAQPDAERRLRQMYQQCEILACREQALPRRVAPPGAPWPIDPLPVARAGLTVQEACTR